MYLVEVTQYDVINWYMQVPDASTELGAMGGTFGFHLVTSPLAVVATHREVGEAGFSWFQDPFQWQ